MDQFEKKWARVLKAIEKKKPYLFIRTTDGGGIVYFGTDHVPGLVLVKKLNAPDGVSTIQAIGYEPEVKLEPMTKIASSGELLHDMVQFLRMSLDDKPSGASQMLVGEGGKYAQIRVGNDTEKGQPVFRILRHYRISQGGVESWTSRGGKENKIYFRTCPEKLDDILKYAYETAQALNQGQKPNVCECCGRSWK